MIMKNYKKIKPYTGEKNYFEVVQTCPNCGNKIYWINSLPYCGFTIECESILISKFPNSEYPILGA